jgi:hypothetical protein
MPFATVIGCAYREAGILKWFDMAEIRWMLNQAPHCHPKAIFHGNRYPHGSLCPEWLESPPRRLIRYIWFCVYDGFIASVSDSSTVSDLTSTKQPFLPAGKVCAAERMPDRDRNRSATMPAPTPKAGHHQRTSKFSPCRPQHGQHTSDRIFERISKNHNSLFISIAI